jgi:hypothetical protein
MTCKEFESLLHDFEFGGAELQSQVQQAGLTHAAHCPRCAARLADERSLAAGFRGLVLIAEGQKALPGLESKLLEAFRQKHGTSESEEQGTGSPGLIRSPNPDRARRRSLIPEGRILAAAAVMLLGVLSYLFIRGRTEAPRPPDPVPQAARPAPASPPVLVKKNSDSGLTEASVSSRRVDKPLRRADRVVRQKATLKSQSSSAVNTFPRAPAEPQGDDDAEVRTEFLPWMAVRPMSADEHGQLVRVRLPRSALQTFGLPVNMERFREPVQADVLIGEDGRALAVRFVR